MSGTALLSLELALGAATALRANTADGDPRRERLFSQFIAPCSWQETLLSHHLPKADELRSEILAMVAAGETDEQIKAALVARYTTRIFSEPDGVRGQWLSWIPSAAIIIGLGTVVVAIRRLRLPPAATPHADLSHLPPDEEWDR